MYSNTLPGSPLRDVVVDHFATMAPVRIIQECVEDFPREMLVEMVVKMRPRPRKMVCDGRGRDTYSRFEKEEWKARGIGDWQ